MSMELELALQENSILQAELNKTKDKLANAKRLLEGAAPLIETVKELEHRERFYAKKITMIQGFYFNWEIKTPWQRFWSTGALLNSIAKVLIAKES